MKASDRDYDAALAQPGGDVERARKLIRLHADQHHHAGVSAFYQRGYVPGANARVRLVKSVDFEFDIITEDLMFSAFERQTIQHGEGVRRNRGSQPLNHVTFVVIVRRLDEYQAETSLVIGHVLVSDA